MQAFFTVLLAAAFLGDRPTFRQSLGMAIAFAGLALIGLTVGANLPLAALGLALAGAFSWAVGNVLVKRQSGVPVFPLVVWASLVPPISAILLGGGIPPLVEAVRNASWSSLAAAVYLGALATVLAYAVWGGLLQRHSTAVVAALRAPCTVHRRRVVGAGVPRALRPAALRGHGPRPGWAGRHRAAREAPLMTDHGKEPAAP